MWYAKSGAGIVWIINNDLLQSTQKFLQDEKCYLQAGKVQTLLRLFKEYQAEGRRMLIFSQVCELSEYLHLKININNRGQFTQILDILQSVFKMQKVKYLLLTGATAVDVRQSLVDEFNENESIPCFLLSTKAGGMGINLTAASVVILCVDNSMLRMPVLISNLRKASTRILTHITISKRRIVLIVLDKSATLTS
jgi:SNF2 family DNA or RNA helicase